MASAYELMLVLRGRNYLSNDLRRAGADISRLKSQAGLQNARQQLQINAQRLAGTRAIAQAEATSLTSGQRNLALQKARANYTAQHLAAAKKLNEAENALNANGAAQVANAERLAAVQTQLGRTPAGSNNAASLTEMQRRLVAVDRELIAEQAKLNSQLLVTQNTMSKVAITEQQLIATETAHAQRLAILTDRINTTDAALDLNTIKLRENALAIQRLPLESLGAKARYVEHLGRAFQTLGLVSVAALGLAAHSAAKFNTEVTLAATQSTTVTNNSTRQVLRNAGVLQAAIQKMLISGQTAAKPADLTGGLYTIFSGISLKGNQQSQLKQGISILKEFNKVFTANFGQVEFNDVVKTGISLINNFGLTASQLPNVMNRMQASVRFGAMSMGDFVGSLNQVIPAFRGAHYGFDQMAADVAFVSRLFPSLRFGTTGLARLTETFAKYHDAISHDVGRNIAPGGNLLTINEIVKAIVAAHPQLAKGGVDLQNYFKAVTGATSTVQARRAFVGYATQMSLYNDVAGKVLHDNNELAKSFTDMSQTPQVRWTEFTNQLRGLVMEIGASAIPVFQKFAGPIQDAVKWFDSLSSSNKQLIGEIAVWSSIGMLLGGTFLVIAGAAARVYVAFRLWRLGVIAKDAAELAAKTDGLKTALGGLSSEAGSARLLFAAKLGIPALLITMVVFHKQTGEVISRLGGFQHVITAVGLAFATWKIIGYIAKLVELSKAFYAARVAAKAAAAAETAAGAAALVAAGEVDVLAASVISLEALLAAPLVLTVLLSYEMITHPNKLKEIVKTGVDSGVFVDEKGNVTLRSHTASRGPGANIVRPLTPEQQAAFGKAAGNINRSAGFGGIGRDTRPRGAGDVNRAAAFGGTGSDITAWAQKHAAAAANWNVNSAIANLEKLRAISEKAPSIENYKRYEEAKAALEKHFTGTALTALNDYLNNIESAEKKSNRGRLSEAKKAAAERLKALKDAAANAMSMYDQLLSQNQSVMGQLFSGPYINSPQVQNRVSFGGKLTATDYLKDLKSQTAQFRTFYAQIAKLQRRGAPQELVQQLIQAGPSALPAIKALSSMGAGQWGQYIKVFKTGQTLLHKQTMIQLTAQLKDYRKYGEKIALQIISGMRDKRLGLANEIQSIIKQIFGVDTPTVTGPKQKALADATKAAKQHAGKTPHGVYTHNSTNTKPVGGTGSRTTQGVEYHTHYHVVAPTSEHTSIKTQLRHADFAAKAKYERTR